MSDSDSDDSLLNKSTFKRSRRPSRAESRKKARRLDILDDALEESKKSYNSTVRLSQIKQEHEDHDDEKLKERAAAMSESKTSRRDFEDALEGLDLYKDHALPRNELRARVMALDTDASCSSLGARKTLSFDPNRSSNPIKFYNSYDEAKVDLECILKKLENTLNKGKENRKRATASSKKTTSDEIIEKIRIAVEADMLEVMLEQLRLSFLLSKNEKQYLHKDLTVWLCAVALSAGLGSPHLQRLAMASMKSLVSLLKDGKLDPADYTNTIESFCESIECWIDLDAMGKQHAKVADESADPPLNLVGLSHLLSLWEGSNSTCSSPSMETATRIVVALTRLGLDDRFVKRGYSFESGTTKSLKHALTGIIDLVVANNKEDTEKWMQMTAEAVVQDLSILGPGDSKAEDADDHQAWLSHCRTVRFIPSRDREENIHEPLVQFKILVIMQALQKCLGVPDLVSLVHASLSKSGHQSLLAQAASSRCWLAVASAFVALAHLEKQHDDILDTGNAPLCLATIDCALSAFQEGMLSMSMHVSEGEREYGGREDAKTANDFLSLLLELCSKLSRTIGKASNHSHFRRADELLISFRQYILKVSNRASSQAGVRNVSLVQKDVRNYFVHTSP